MQKTLQTVIALGGILALALNAPAAPAAKYTLKFATLAPEGSAWMQTFEQVKKDVSEATGGAVQVKVYPAGVLGEEKDVLFKIKVGQVDGGAFMGYGMGIICPDSRAMMMPMVFNNIDEVDHVLARLSPYLEEKSATNGFVMLGWSEIGFSYLYSAAPVRSLADLRGAKPWAIPNDPIIGELFKAGNISAIPVPVGDTLTALQTGMIQTVFAPPLVAVAMQWYTKAKYRNDAPLLYSFGGLFVSNTSWSRVPPDFRARIVDICHKRITELNAQMRTSNQEALNVMASNSIETVKSSPENLREIEAMSTTALQHLKGTIFSAESYDLVQRYLGEYRKSAQAAGSAK